MNLTAWPSRKEAIDDTVEALTCGHYNTIGVLGPESPGNADILKKVKRRAKRDGLFDVVVRATVSDKPNNREIQDKIAKALGLRFDDKKDVAKRAGRLRIGKALFCIRDDVKDESERANTLRERIQRENKVLVMLHDLCRGIDLDEVGIPYGAAHPGCMLLLTSASEEVLSEDMHAQKIIKV